MYQNLRTAPQQQFLISAATRFAIKDRIIARKGEDAKRAFQRIELSTNSMDGWKHIIFVRRAVQSEASEIRLMVTSSIRF